MEFDLLTTVECGGCSAKLSPTQLTEVLSALPQGVDSRLLVGIGTQDDAGVWQLSDDLALIQTTDFFPPICSDPYDFGQIAAANALSDVYAMGGRPINALGLVMFPHAEIPLAVLHDILRGGSDKVAESGAVMVGGHTIDDSPPKYGLAVTGVVHPSRLVTNASARAGEVVVLTKPLGTGAIVAGHRAGESRPEAYQAALASMKLLNRNGADVMQEFGVRCATDVTGFGLVGHALRMADASHVTINLEAAKVPLLEDAYRLIDLGCIPGAAFRNLSSLEGRCRFATRLDYNLKMAMLDPQTSGGLLFTITDDRADQALKELRRRGLLSSGVIGQVVERQQESVRVS